MKKEDNEKIKFLQSIIDKIPENDHDYNGNKLIELNNFIIDCIESLCVLIENIDVIEKEPINTMVIRHYTKIIGLLKYKSTLHNNKLK